MTSDNVFSDWHNITLLEKFQNVIKEQIFCSFLVAIRVFPSWVYILLTGHTSDRYSEGMPFQTH